MHDWISALATEARPSYLADPLSSHSDNPGRQPLLLHDDLDDDELEDDDFFDDEDDEDDFLDDEDDDKDDDSDDDYFDDEDD